MMARVGRREEILAIACRLFSQKGYHGTTIRDISEACGILSGSLYAHINTKEDLLFEITDRGAEAFLGSLEPIVKSGKTASQKLREAVKAHMHVIEANLEAATVFFHEWKALTGDRYEQIRKKRDSYERLWAAILEEGIKSGEFKQLDEKLARLLVLSVANWTYQWYRPGGKLKADEVADRFVEMILIGFQA
ncbi:MULTISPECIES: TetR/AcrR family transcriptional regulator [Thermoactinomyces]|jgi:TetR/AcrR family transcriptional regulator, cholesterol catabolism regulator|nr:MULTISPECIES: TetR/AcrR family transcriptional regulator [Thermoactinomyces]